MQQYIVIPQAKKIPAKCQIVNSNVLLIHLHNLYSNNRWKFRLEPPTC